LIKDLRIRIVGQVRHSKKGNEVGHEKVSSFGTEIQKLRKNTYSSYFINLTKEFLESPFPVIGLFITNSFYTDKAINFANDFGIIIWNEEQIAQDIAVSEFIDDAFDENGDLDLRKLHQQVK
jgi:hypothetical protein